MVMVILLLILLAIAGPCISSVGPGCGRVQVFGSIEICQQRIYQACFDVADLYRTYKEDAGQRCIPQRFVAGYGKAGSTAMYTYLCLHPKLMSPTTKEIHYFFSGVKNDLYDPDGQQSAEGPYLKHMPILTAAQIMDGVTTFDSTPWYFQTADEAAARIYKMAPNAKSVVLLRDPVERYYSSWKMHQRDQAALGLNYSSTAGFNAEVERLTVHLRGRTHAQRMEIGAYNHMCYAEHAHVWFKSFGIDSVLFVFSEDLQRNTTAVMETVTKFWDLPPHDWENESGIRVAVNTATSPVQKKQQDILKNENMGDDMQRLMSPDAKQGLSEVYGHCDAMLMVLLKTALPWRSL